MNLKTRNRLFMLLILAIPFIILFGFIISQLISPSPPDHKLYVPGEPIQMVSPNPSNDTNTVRPPP
jgi:hypothetical protein